MPDDAFTLYLIYIRDPQTPLDPDTFDGMRRLDDALFLIRTTASRSRVYHSVKWACQPAALLVAPLGDDPKFKGMDAGALNWLRHLD
ncbi:hypothetical protein [Henriciella marina]|uniref:hypothetical protein n=1 Tax=Henriciella marina TaxID=453851 RepID=UPI000379C6A5|nr:hypothetical protein [Henriciella marina]